MVLQSALQTPLIRPFTHKFTLMGAVAMQGAAHPTGGNSVSPQSATYTCVSDDGDLVPVDRWLKMSVFAKTWNQGGTNSHDPLSFLHP